ncbi:hypothetical protein [Ideonella sp.]|uniref:hypothetical protein n=1 Tax=Ideonella sp. TaxID=1929293 RepID=UPI003BB5C3FF
MSSTQPKVKGIAGVLPGLVIPPLSLGALEQLQERLRAFDGDALKPENIALVIDAAQAALRRNYPDMTRDQVADLVGLENLVEVYQACMDVGGTWRNARTAGDSSAQEVATC